MLDKQQQEMIFNKNRAAKGARSAPAAPIQTEKSIGNDEDQKVEPTVEAQSNQKNEILDDKKEPEKAKNIEDINVADIPFDYPPLTPSPPVTQKYDNRSMADARKQFDDLNKK